ncbi:hypothetical protein BCV70DRAFT_199320 [Testicularia cyperi]|uniref:Sld7 C-terminal domain-containing protein n=1 Tax=Testicularia cyperi TaxID=1882483 RepID=A0A317XRM6_9BASI|nr:hypothetical protein BCV70DRAFT_199320 [Testicularia cyperi]
MESVRPPILSPTQVTQPTCAATLIDPFASPTKKVLRPHDIAAQTPPPSSASQSNRSPHRSGAKPRLLWRSDLVLQDGTHVPGIAFVSYTDPFRNASTPTRLQPNPDSDDTSRPASALTGEHAAHVGQEEAEAGLCLALEMLRHRPLRIASIITDRGTPTSKAGADSSNLAKVSSFSQSLSQSTVERRTHWVSSGDVRVFLDPHQPSTTAFFQQLFCFDTELIEDAGVKRSANILTVSLDGAASHDTLGDVFSAPSTPASRSELAIFAQPLDDPSRNGDCKVGVGVNVQDSRTGHPQPLRLVLGRKVIVTTKRAAPIVGRDLGRARSFHRQPSAASQQNTLHDVFSQAGINLSQFGGALPMSMPVSASQSVVASTPNTSVPSPAVAATKSSVRTAKEDTIESANRGTIKKIVHHILSREYKLSKTDADYLACYHQTCSGIWCVFRKTATLAKLDKQLVDKFARSHLSLYLDQPSSTPTCSTTNAPSPALSSTERPSPLLRPSS